MICLRLLRVPDRFVNLSLSVNDGNVQTKGCASQCSFKNTDHR